ncbi:MAG: hypothetical protein IKA50_06420 [Clostridia bacterium]|nr:hypothetical protein [Clostridia bacterium]
MKTMKKIVAIMAVALMLCSILPLSVFAADAETIKYTISSYPAGTQYKAETHELDEYLTVITNTRCHFTSELRIYAPSGSVNGEVILASTREMTAVVLNAGNKASTLTVSTSPDNSTWTQHSTLSVASSYKDLSISNLPAGTKYVKLVNGSGQVRVKYITVSYAADVVPEEPPVTCEHVWVDADCTTPKTCSLCGETEGEALGHSYGEATETVAPDCTNAGEQRSTCSACGDVKTETVNALGHNYVDGFCSECGEAQPLEVTIETFANTGVLDGSTSISWTNGGFQFITYKADSSSAIRTSDADHFRIYAHNKVVVSGLNGELLTKVQFNATSASYATVLGGCAAEGWVVSVDGTVVTFTATAANGAENLTIEDVSAQTRVSSVIITPYVASESDCEHDYVGVETQAPSCTVEGVMTYTCSKCGESYTEAIATIPHNYVEDIIDSTCTTTGTKTYECSVCFDSYDEIIPVKPHNYVDDVCADCGAVKAYKGTITFDADKTQRTEYSTSVQKWENEGLVLTNNKADSTTNVGDYGAPGRFYKNSQIIISFPEMSKLIIDASGIGNDYLWDATLEAAGLSFTVESKIYTITFAEPVNSIELTAANQVRANSITAVVAHEHAYDNAFDTDCNKCGEIRAVAGPISFVGKSVSEDVNGYAVLFDANVEGLELVDGAADYTNATYEGYKLLGLGVTASNSKSSINIEGERVYGINDETGALQFAFRIINIPADKLDVEITMVPYYIVEIDGVATTIEGEAVVGSYAEIAG